MSLILHYLSLLFSNALKNQAAPAIKKINNSGANNPTKGANTNIKSKAKSITIYQILFITILVILLLT